jgi:hypothetical protein
LPQPWLPLSDAASAPSKLPPTPPTMSHQGAKLWTKLYQRTEEDIHLDARARANSQKKTLDFATRGRYYLDYADYIDQNRIFFGDREDSNFRLSRESHAESAADSHLANLQLWQH